MRRVLALASIAALMVLAFVVPSSPANAATPTVTSQRNVYSFALFTPNIAAAPNGDRITVTGRGMFEPRTGTVFAGGTFVHRSAAGTVQCRGVWWATALTGWKGFGAGPSHARGGVVSMLVTHYCATTRMIHTGLSMTVTSTRDAPVGSSYVEGTTVDAFTRSVSGDVKIYSCQGAHDGDRSDPGGGQSGSASLALRGGA